MQSNERENGSHTLASLAQLSAAVETAILEANGELSPEVEAMLTVVTETLPAKVDAYKAVLDRLDLASEFYAGKAKQYQTAAKSCTKAIDRLKDNIKYALVQMKASAIEGQDFKFTMSEMASKVVISGDVPKEYMKEVIKLEPDTDAIRSALVMGEELPFAHLQPVYALRSGIRKKG